MAQALFTERGVREGRTGRMRCSQTRPLLVCLRLAPVVGCLALSLALLRHGGGGPPTARGTNIVALAMTSNVPLLSFTLTNPAADVFPALADAGSRRREEAETIVTAASPPPNVGGYISSSALEHNVWARCLASGRR